VDNWSLFFPMVFVLAIVMVKVLLIFVLIRVMMTHPGHLVLVWVFDVVVRVLVRIVVVVLVSVAILVMTMHAVGSLMVSVPILLFRVVVFARPMMFMVRIAVIS